MDLLFKRYASPFIFLDGYIQTGRFCEFIDELGEIFSKEEEEQKLWEVYLHKIWDKSFVEFREQLETDRNNRNMSKGDFETTITHSMNILKNFNPEEKG